MGETFLGLSLVLAVLGFVASRAKCNQVLRCIVPKMAPPLDVVNLQVFHRTAILTSPAIPLENLCAKQSVRFSFKS